MDQKKYRQVGKNFKKSVMAGIILTLGVLTLAPSQAYAQKPFEGVGDHVSTEINKTAKELLGGIFESARERMQHDRNERDATYKTGTTAGESARREAIINGSSGGQSGGDMVTRRTINVNTSTDAYGNPTHTVNSSINSQNNTSASIKEQQMYDQLNYQRQVEQVMLQRELDRMRAENEALKRQAQERATLTAQQQQQLNTASTYYQGNGANTTTTLSQRDQQMLQNCQNLQNRGATVLPDSCNNVLQTAFKITPRQ